MPVSDSRSGPRIRDIGRCSQTACYRAGPFLSRHGFCMVCSAVARLEFRIEGVAMVTATEQESLARRTDLAWPGRAGFAHICRWGDRLGGSFSDKTLVFVLARTIICPVVCRSLLFRPSLHVAPGRMGDPVGLYDTTNSWEFQGRFSPGQVGKGKLCRTL